MFTRTLRAAGLLGGGAFLGLLAGCTGGNEPVKLTPSEAAAARAASAASAALVPSTPNPHAGAMGGASANPHAGAPPAATSAPRSAGSLQFTVPAGWKVQTPTSTMRKAQFLLPRAGSDAEDAALVLFHFGGEGGSKAANFERWGTYFRPAGGGAPQPLATTTRSVNDLEVTEASASGTLDLSQVQGMGSGFRENYAMLVAYVETPTGPYFARLLGPAATVNHWEASFREWISSLQHTP